MTRRRPNRPNIPRPRAQAVDLSDSNIRTSSTVGTPAGTDTTSTTPRTDFEYDVTDEVIPTSDGKFLGMGSTLAQVSMIFGACITVATVVYTAFNLLDDVEVLSDKLSAVGNSVTKVEDTAKGNSNRLDVLNSSVDRVEQEVRDTKDLVNELRIDNARSGSRDEPDNRSDN